MIAVGTTVVRALESAWDGERVRAANGFTRLFVHPQRYLKTVDGLITGLHDPQASHLAMLHAIAGEELDRRRLSGSDSRRAICGTSSATAT